MAYLCSPAELLSAKAADESIWWTPAPSYRPYISCPYCGCTHVTSNGHHPKPETKDDGTVVIHHIPRFICKDCSKAKGQTVSFTLYAPGLLPYTRHPESFVLYAVERRIHERPGSAARRTKHMQPKSRKTRQRYQMLYLSLTGTCRVVFRLVERFSDRLEEKIQQLLNHGQKGGCTAGTAGSICPAVPPT